MRKHYDIDPADVDPDGICEAQLTGGAADLTLDGALCSDGQFIIGDNYSTGISGVRLSVDSEGDISSVVFTITGEDQNSNAISETVTGVTTTAVETENFFSKITQIAADSEVTSNVFIGTVDEVCTKYIPINYRSGDPFQIAVLGETGSVNYKIRETFAQMRNQVPANWIDKYTNKTSDMTGELSLRATGVQLIVNNYTSGFEMQFHVNGV